MSLRSTVRRRAFDTRDRDGACVSIFLRLCCNFSRVYVLQSFVASEHETSYTSMGGSALYIETQAIRRGLDPEGKPRGGGSLKVTGQLGDVMKESTQIAYTVARALLYESDPDSMFFDSNDIHTHVPEGATPKDGPSAGITIVTSMLSLAMDKPVRNDLAMTGEISLTGRVLAVGGIKEKVMAAKRAGIKCLILPAANQRDFDEIPEYLKDDLEVHFCDDFDQVFKVAFE